MNDLEKKLYEIAGQEIAAKTMVPALAAKAFSDAEGDEKKTLAADVGQEEIVNDIEADTTALSVNPTTAKGAVDKDEWIGTATFSIIAPVVSFVLGVLFQPVVRLSRIAMFVQGLVSTLLILMGLVCGITAAIAIKRRRQRAGFARAIVGTCVCAVLTAAMILSVTMMIHAAERTRSGLRDQTEHR